MAVLLRVLSRPKVGKKKGVRSKEMKEISAVRVDTGEDKTIKCAEKKKNILANGTVQQS